MTDLQTSPKAFEVQVDEQSPQSWAQILARFDDASIYQSWAYGTVRWGEHNLSHLVLRENGEIVAAAQLRIVRIPFVNAGVAYLRWGPMCRRQSEPLDSKTIPKMLACLREEYCGRRGLALKIIPNTYVGDDRESIVQKTFHELGFQIEKSGPQYRTVMVNLTRPTELIRKQLDQKWRNQLNRSEKNGLTFESSDIREAYLEFVRLYKPMLARKQFETSVDVEEFGRIQDHLVGAARMQTFLARKDGEAIGALVCSLFGDTAIYLLGATNEKARELKAAYFLQWQAMMWLKERGAAQYDLGGIDPNANPGGYHFKSGFGGKEVVQVHSHCFSGSTTSEMLFRGINWLHHRRAALVHTK